MARFEVELALVQRRVSGLVDGGQQNDIASLHARLSDIVEGAFAVSDVFSKLVRGAAARTNAGDGAAQQKAPYPLGQLVFRCSARRYPTEIIRQNRNANNLMRFVSRSWAAHDNE